MNSVTMKKITRKTATALGLVLVAGMALAAPDQDRSSLVFDGGDDQVLTSDLGDWGPDMINGFAVSAWYRHSSDRDRQMILGERHGRQWLLLQLNGDDAPAGYPQIRNRDNAGNEIGVFVNSGPPTNDGQWHHIVFNVRGASVDDYSIWLDGTNKELEIGRGPATHTSFVKRNVPITLGFYNRSRRGAHSNLVGELSDVRIYDGPLTSTQIRSLHDGVSVDEGLRAHWPLDEGSGKQAMDRSGNGHHGQISGAEWRSPAGDTVTTDADSADMADESAPPLAMDGEDCVRFNPESAELQDHGDDVRLVDGSHALILFDNHDEGSRSLDVMRYYGFNRSCFVGRPSPPLHYFLVDDRAPAGEMPGEDCVDFDPDQVEARQIDGNWKIAQGDRWLKDFGDARIQAYTALAIIRHHGFTQNCFVARPDPALSYMRRDGDPVADEGDDAGANGDEDEPVGAAPAKPHDDQGSETILSVPQENLVLHLDAAHGYDDGVWFDQGPIGHDTAQPDPDRRPRLVENAASGHPALAFDGENDVLVSSLDINPGVLPEITVFIVFDSRTDERVYRKLFGHDNGGFDRAVGLDRRSSDNLVFFGGRLGRTTSIVDIVADRWYLLTMTYTEDSASAWVDGVEKVSGVQVNNGSGEPVTMIGNGGAGSAEWWGSIAEMVVYGTSLPETRRQDIEQRLKDKYGL